MSSVKRWRNKYTVAPIDVKPGDGFAIKVVAVVYGTSWAAYYGKSDWTDERIAEQGDKIYDAALAGGLFSVLALSGLPYARP